jgi:hypothetical protein
MKTALLGVCTSNLRNRLLQASGRYHHR